CVTTSRAPSSVRTTATAIRTSPTPIPTADSRLGWPTCERSSCTRPVMGRPPWRTTEMSEIEMPEKVRIEAGERTEELIQSLLDELDQLEDRGEAAEDVDVQREQPTSSGVASEPITTACVVGGLGLAGIFALARAVEKWL